VVGLLFDEVAWTTTRSKFGGVTMGYSGDTDRQVADFQPRSICGDLSDGTSVSVVDAQGGRKFELYPIPLRQEFKTIRHVVMGEHVDGDKQTYASIKFRIEGPHHWGANDGDAFAADGGLLALRSVGAHRWFEYAPTNPLSLDEFGSRVINPITTLVSIATRNSAADTELFVQSTRDSQWRRVYRERDPVSKRNRPLFEAGAITAEQFAAWIDLRALTDGLDAAAIDDLDGVAIQTQVLALASIAEGLHRRLFEDRRRVASLAPTQTRQLRRAAREAALQRFDSLDRPSDDPLTDQDRTELAQAINDAFGFINEQTFKSRMQDLVDEAKMAVPAIVTAFADWPNAVGYARNILAHKGTEPQSDTTDQFLDLLMALSYSISWVLRTVLLRRGGFEDDSIREAFKDSSAYNHHITNTKWLLANGPHGTAG
jgi:hypothetical protein